MHCGISMQVTKTGVIARGLVDNTFIYKKNLIWRFLLSCFDKSVYGGASPITPNPHSTNPEKQCLQHVLVKFFKKNIIWVNFLLKDPKKFRWGIINNMFFKIHLLTSSKRLLAMTTLILPQLNRNLNIPCINSKTFTKKHLYPR